MHAAPHWRWQLVAYVGIMVGLLLTVYGIQSHLRETRRQTTILAAQDKAQAATIRSLCDDRLLIESALEALIPVVPAAAAASLGVVHRDLLDELTSKESPCVMHH